MDISLTLAEKRFWNTLHGEPAVTDVLLPVLHQALPAEAQNSGPWTAVRWTLDHVDSDAFAHALSQHSQGGQNNGLTLSSRRRFRILAAPCAAAMVMERTNHENVPAAPFIDTAVTAGRALEETLREWSQKSVHPRLSASPAELEALLPVMITWMVAGPAVRRLALSEKIDDQERTALESLLRFTVEHLPERKPRPWSKVEPAIIQELPGKRMHFGSWVGYGAFALDPMQNPVTRGSEWSSNFIMEPLVRAFGKTVDGIASTFDLIRRKDSLEQQLLEADERGVLENLISRESVFYAGGYFSPHVSLSIAVDGKETNASRLGLDAASPIRTRALRAVFDMWVQKLTEKGMPLTNDHLRKRASAARHFDSDSWKEVNTEKLGPSFQYTSSDVFHEAEPWGEKGRTRVLSQLVPMFDVRLQLLRVLLRIEDPQTPKAKLREEWSKASDIVERLRELHSLKLLHRLEPVAADAPLPKDTRDSEAYWRRILTAQPNPYCGLVEPENLIRGLLPNAVYRRVQATLATIWPEGAADSAATFAAREELAARIWQTASKRSLLGGAKMSLEETLLGASLEVALSPWAKDHAPAFRREHAFALSFSVAMGGGGEPRMPDMTQAAQDARKRALHGSISLADLLATGNASVAAQLAVDWGQCAKSNNADVHRDARLRSLHDALSAVRAVAKELTGKESLGSALKKPSVWAQILPDSQEWARWAKAVIAEPSKHPAALIHSDTIQVGSAPLLSPKIAAPLAELSNRGQFLYGVNVPGLPKERLDIDWAKAVLVTGVEAMAPMLDAFAIGDPTQAFRPVISQVGVIEAAGMQSRSVVPEFSAQKIYSSKVSEWENNHQNHPLGGVQSMMTASFAYLTAIPRFLEAETHSARSALSILGKTDTVLTADALKDVGNALYAVFRRNAKGVLGSNAQAVVWAANLLQSIDEAPGAAAPHLANALRAFLDTHERIVSDRNPRNEGAKATNWSEIDQQYANAADRVKEEFVRGFSGLGQQVFWHLRANVHSAVHQNMQREAREEERLHLGPDAMQKSQVAMLSAAYSGIINAHRYSAMYVKNPAIVRPKSLAQPPPQSPTTTPAAAVLPPAPTQVTVDR